MQLWQDGVVALFAAIGVASLVWTAVRAFVCTRPAGRWEAVVLVPAQGDGAQVEAQVQLLRCLRCEAGAFGQILLVDCGLSEEGRALCALLAQEDRQVALCARDQIENYLP